MVYRQTPMHWAANGGHVDAIKALKEAGADVTAKDGHGRTPMRWAAKRGRVNVFKALKEAGQPKSKLGRFFKNPFD